MKKPKISVIVPVYNVEKYVEKCLDSLTNQTYDNLEIIVVDDCSTDLSYSIVKEYIVNKKNILLFQNNKNSGLSYTRNFALSQATGDYISYIDSDDFIPIDYYEQMIKKVNEDNPSIVVCDMMIIDELSGIPKRNSCFGKNNFDFVCNNLAASACNKLFKKELMKKYKFSEGKINEDLAVVIPLLVEADKISYTDKTYYNYIQRKSSIQNSSFSDKRFDIFYAVELTLERIKDVNEYDKYAECIVYYQIIALFIYVIPKEKSFIKRYKWLKKFNELSNKYNIRQNHYFWEFLHNQPIKTKYYYKILFKCDCNSLYLICNIIISIGQLLMKLRKKIIKKDITWDLLIKYAIKQKNMKNPDLSISVVVPNYNYEKFLLQRIYSIISQTYKINEIIILDDLSKDNSRDLINQIENKLDKYINIKTVFNDKNSGSAFKQWKKGFNLANSDYVWIAEADDYCDKNLLINLIYQIKKENDVIISYADTAFINAEGRIIVKSIIPEIDIMKTGHWNNSFINNGVEEYKKYAFLNCTIANVSSCIIKKGNYDKEFELSGKLKQAGDWLFYVNIMQKGKVAYTNKVLNYYRLHGDNVSSNFNYNKHLEEIKYIHEYYRNNYGLTKYQEDEIQKRYKFLKDAWKIGDDDEKKID